MKSETEFSALSPRERSQALIREFEDIKKRLDALGAETSRWAAAAQEAESVVTEATGRLVHLGDTGDTVILQSSHHSSGWSVDVPDQGADLSQAGWTVTTPLYSVDLTGTTIGGTPLHHESRVRVLTTSVDWESQPHLVEAAQAFEAAARLLLSATEDAVDEIRSEREVTLDLIAKIEARLGIPRDAD